MPILVMLLSQFQRTLFYLLIVAFALFNSTLSFGQISGIVYRDYNLNGVRDSTNDYEEAVVNNAIIKIYNPTGLVASTTTDAKGKYIFNNTTNPPYRLELSLPSVYDFETVISSQNSGSQSAIRFELWPKSIINFGINYPDDYNKDASVITPCYVFGDPLASGTLFGTTEALVKFGINNGGTTSIDAKTISNGGLAPNLEILSRASEIGSTWGVAVQKKTQSIFTAACLKRHVGLGPSGIDAIYHIDIQNHNVIHTINLQNLGINTGSTLSNSLRGLPNTFPPKSKDSLTFSLIGKVGIAAIDLSEDEKTLYIINLHTRKVYSIFINSPFVNPSPNQVDSFDIPNPSCANGEFRPWALKVYRGRIYVGVVCDASISQNSTDLDAFVYELNPVSKSWNKVLEFSLDYPGINGGSRFNPWIDQWDPNCQQGNNFFCDYPQAILMGIDFESQDVMFISIGDRYGFQTGFTQYNTSGKGSYSSNSFGDILKARKLNNNSHFTLENNGNDGQLETAGKNTGIGPGSGEFFYGDHSLYNDGSFNSPESGLGAVVNCPGHKSILMNTYNPFDILTNGIVHLNKKTGQWTKRYEILAQNPSNFNGKSSGLGDLRLTSQSPPIQIGNYVWRDLNSNGIQDPQEQGIPNIEVELLENGNVIATAITNSLGQYLFSNENLIGINSNPDAYIYSIDALKSSSTYTIQIKTNQVNLTNFTPTTTKVNFPTNIQIDNDGSVVNPNLLSTIIQTQLDGQNDFSIDFGFIPNDPCEISLVNFKKGECNSLTNSFELSLNVHVTNFPIGYLEVELSSGEKNKIYITQDGTYNVLFKNLENKNLNDIDIQIKAQNNSSCTLTATDAFDHTPSCCDLNHQLCSNRTNQIRLNAIPKMAQYRWYKKSDNSIVGFTDQLNINNLFTGLEDGEEDYYFIAIDSTGDTIRQFCYYNVKVIDCCNLNINTFIQTDCNNNNTTNNPDDDWFSVLINAINPTPGNSSSFEILSGSTVLGTSAYGAPVLVGTPNLPDFKADGQSIYKLVIRDIDDPTCQDSVFTIPSECPQPKISVSKTFVSTSILSDASYNIIYKIDVENTGGSPGFYSLQDDPGFDDDILIKTAYYTTNVSLNTGAALFGQGPWTLVSNQPIPAFTKHTYQVVINLSINLKLSSSGDNLYSPCQNRPLRNQGLFNRALIDLNNDGLFDLIDTVCADIPVFTVHKELISTTQLDLYRSKLIYEIRVKNLGGASGQYNLFEDPMFDDDISIQSTQYSINSGTFSSLSLPEPINGWRIASQRNIAPSSEDIFNIEFIATLDLRSNSIGDNIYKLCSTPTPINQRQERGLFNVTGIDLNNDQRPELRDTSCGDLPSLSHEKVLVKNIITGPHSNEVTYLFIVQNLGGAAGTYSLEDKLAFEDDIEVTSCFQKINNSAFTPIAGINSQTTINLVNNKLLNPGEVDSIWIILNLDLNLSKNSSGDNLYSPCNLSINNDFQASQGLFNESRLEVNQDGIIDQKDTVCTDFKYYDLALRKKVLNSSAIRFDEKVFFRHTIFNQGTQTAFNIILTDYLSKSYLYVQANNQNWILVNDSTVNYKIDSLQSGDSVNIDLVLIFKNNLPLSAVINSSEISEFKDESNSVVLDIDSKSDQNRRNDNTVIPYSANDDEIFGQYLFNSNEDEDDSDIAQPIVIDLALSKKINKNLNLEYNSLIPFSITIYNQGNQTIYSTTIADHIPAGFEFDQLANPEWVINSSIASLTVSDSIVSGDSITKTIYLKLLKATNSSHWLNVSEITNFTISNRVGAHSLTLDIDSNMDTNPNNDKGGIVNSPSDNNISSDPKDRSNTGIMDEDDHDPALPCIWDLALKKELLTSPPHIPGVLLNFQITIYNQGTDTVSEVTVVDYLTDGYLFQANENIGWTINGNKIEYKLTKRINPDESEQIHLFLRLKEGLKPKESYINYAEILSSKNSFNEDKSNQDIDSHSGSNTDNEKSILPDSAGDNVIDDSSKGQNEDDHDPAAPLILDIALIKTNKIINPIKYSDTLEFEIKVTNQGYISINQFTLIDYIPTGLAWISNPGWTHNPPTRSSTRIFNSTLQPGQTFSANIKLKFNTPLTLNPDLINFAEIVSVKDSLGNLYLRDIDSQFDNDKFNDPGGIPKSLSDNFVFDDGNDSDNDGIIDEDDHDPDMISLIDFALKKEINPNNRNLVGDTAEFNIKVVNQGNTIASKISIIDYITTAYKFIPSINPDWTLVGSDVIGNKIYHLIPGDSITFKLKLEILQDNNQNNYCNYAEIFSIKDEQNNEIADLDADSKPNTNSLYERTVKPNSTFDNMLSGRGSLYNEDEDDHDVASAGGTAKIGDMVWLDKNGNGIMDNGEEGIRNILIQLFDANNNKLIKSIRTNSLGKYLFEDISPGKYFIKASPSSKYSFSPANKTNDTFDSDITNSMGSGTTDMFMLIAGADDRTWDIGLYECATIDGFVFLDRNRNGIFETSDNGINGIYVSLYSMPGNILIAKMKTYSQTINSVYHDGYYKFCVIPGTYYIKIESLPGFNTSPYLQGSDYRYDSDLNNSNGNFTSPTYTVLSSDQLKYINGGLINPNLNNLTTTTYKLIERSSSNNLTGAKIANQIHLKYEILEDKCNSLNILYKKSSQGQWLLREIRKTEESINDNCHEEFIDTDNNYISDHSTSYQVQSLDLNGEISFSNIVEFNNESSNNEVYLFPNPASDIITAYWSTSDSNEIYDIEIRNLEGKLISKAIGNKTNEYSFDCSGTANGLYQLTVSSKDKVISKIFNILH